MNQPILTRPAEGEYAPFYAGYIAKSPAGDLTAHLAAQRDETRRMLGGLDDSTAGHRYEPGKWSIKEVIGHLIDSERVIAYRLLRIARGDSTPLPGFDQDAYVPMGRFDRRSMQDLLEEFSAVRDATIRLLRSLDREALDRRGIANGNPISAKAIVFIIAGHERHHVEVLQERYGLR